MGLVTDVRAPFAKCVPSYDTWPLLLLTPGQEEVLNQISSGPCMPSEIAVKNETTVHSAP